MRPLLVSRTWFQAAILVFLFGFFVLGYLALRTYQEQPPIPERVVDPSGQVVYTREDVIEGQRVFLRNVFLTGAASALGWGPGALTRAFST